MGGGTCGARGGSVALAGAGLGSLHHFRGDFAPSLVFFGPSFGLFVAKTLGRLLDPFELPLSAWLFSSSTSCCNERTSLNGDDRASSALCSVASTRALTL